jgi:hypothetical protein
MQYVEGTTLKAVVEDGGAIDLLEGINVLTDICKGLQAAHDADLVHRDIKPENILISTKGEVRITDFGLVRGGELLALTDPNAILGTPYFISPEQCQGEETDARTDIYSLGVLAYYIFTGVKPFDGGTPFEIMSGHLNKEPADPRTHKRDLPEPVALMILRMIKKKMDDRYQSVAAILKDLNRFVRTIVKEDTRRVQDAARAVVEGLRAEGALPEIPMARDSKRGAASAAERKKGGTSRIVEAGLPTLRDVESPVRGAKSAEDTAFSDRDLLDLVSAEGDIDTGDHEYDPDTMETLVPGASLASIANVTADGMAQDQTIFPDREGLVLPKAGAGAQGARRGAPSGPVVVQQFSPEHYWVNGFVPQVMRTYMVLRNPSAGMPFARFVLLVAVFGAIGAGICGFLAELARDGNPLIAATEGNAVGNMLVSLRGSTAEAAPLLAKVSVWAPWYILLIVLFVSVVASVALRRLEFAGQSHGLSPAGVIAWSTGAVALIVGAAANAASIASQLHAAEAVGSAAVRTVLGGPQYMIQLLAAPLLLVVMVAGAYVGLARFHNAVVERLATLASGDKGHAAAPTPAAA